MKVVIYHLIYMYNREISLVRMVNYSSQELLNVCSQKRSGKSKGARGGPCKRKVTYSTFADCGIVTDHPYDSLAKAISPN